MFGEFLSDLLHDIAKFLSDLIYVCLHVPFVAAVCALAVGAIAACCRLLQWGGLIG